MIRNYPIVSVLVVSAVVGVIVAVLWPGMKERGAVPPITGQVQNFILAQAPGPGPETAWRDADGGSVSLADFRGQVVMLNFWATWCAPCIRELPSIDRLQAELAGDDFAVVAVNIDRGGVAVAAPFSERLGLRNLKVYVDAESTFARAVRVNVMPTTVVYDRSGRELGRLEGAAEWDTPEAIALLRWFIQDQR